MSSESGFCAEPEIISQLPSPLKVIAESIGISSGEARTVILALIRSGFVLAPLEPTNSMFSAYIEALQNPTRRHQTAIRNIAKARKRWKAMAQAGLAVALSRKREKEVVSALFSKDHKLPNQDNNLDPIAIEACAQVAETIKSGPLYYGPDGAPNSQLVIGGEIIATAIRSLIPNSAGALAGSPRSVEFDPVVKQDSAPAGTVSHGEMAIWLYKAIPSISSVDCDVIASALLSQYNVRRK